MFCNGSYDAGDGSRPPCIYFKVSAELRAGGAAPGCSLAGLLSHLVGLSAPSWVKLRVPRELGLGGVLLPAGEAAAHISGSPFAGHAPGISVALGCKPCPRLSRSPVRVSRVPPTRCLHIWKPLSLSQSLCIRCSSIP